MVHRKVTTTIELIFVKREFKDAYLLLPVNYPNS
jgi:hypothetical protein